MNKKGNNLRVINLQGAVNKHIYKDKNWNRETSWVHGPLTSSGLRTFCHRCKHCTSDLSGKDSAAWHKGIQINHKTPSKHLNEDESTQSKLTSK